MIHNFLVHVAGTQVSSDDVGIPEVPLNNSAIADALSATFIVVGALGVLFLLAGAVRYVMSNGDQAKVKQAKDTIVYAVIGIVVSLSAFTIVQFTLGKLSGSI